MKNAEQAFRDAFTPLLPPSYRLVVERVKGSRVIAIQMSKPGAERRMCLSVPLNTATDDASLDSLVRDTVRAFNTRRT